MADSIYLSSTPATTPVLGQSISTTQPTTPTVPKTPDFPQTTPVAVTPVTDRFGNTKTFTNEATGSPWNVKDYANDYSAEANRIMKIDPADPRLDVLEKARADKILADPTKYKDQLQWANDIKSGQWNAQDYSNNYQAEIDRLRTINAADPRIDRLEHLRAAKILASPTLYDTNTKDWATNVDRRNWNADNYSRDYSAEINRIKAFDPTDPRIQQLQDARAMKVLDNPGAYDQKLVDEARQYMQDNGDRMARAEVNRNYTESETQADLQNQRTAQQIKDYYAGKGMGNSGQAAEAFTENAMAGNTAMKKSEASRIKDLTTLTLQQQAQKAAAAVEKQKAAVDNAKTQAQLQEAQIGLQKAQIEYQKAGVELSKARSSGSSGGGSKSSKSSSNGLAVINKAYTDYKTTYQKQLDNIETVSPGGWAALNPANWKKDPNKIREVIKSIDNNGALTAEQKAQMKRDITY